MLTIRTVREGERIAIWDMQGRIKFVDGPRRLYLFRKQIQLLPHYTAGSDEYLAVEFVDGRCDHLRGPASLWFDPIRHQSVEVCAALPLDSHEAIVVYRRQQGEVDRRIERGPAMFVPKANEWLHDFSWHGANPKNPHRKIPRALHFEKLRIIPDQTYHHVEDVRTADDALLTVKLMIFFELVDIDTMLDQTHDPIADFINAVTADIVDFVGARKFETFKQEIESLNELQAYPNLTTRAQRIGYRINKVVYRGFVASDTLQSMHDGAIEARTQLQLAAETESQAQDLSDLKQAREAVREKQRQEMEQALSEHNVRIQRVEHDERMRRVEAERNARVAARRQMNQVQLEHQRAGNEEKTQYMATMKEMQVDLTRYLVAQYQNPDRLIRISGENGAQLHLHDDA